LRNGGMSEDDIEKLKQYVKNRYVSASDFKYICEEFNIQIHLKNISWSNNRQVKKYGNKDTALYKLGLVNKHYFIIEDTNITKFSCDNYEYIKDIKDFEKIFRTDIKNGKTYYYRTKNKFINSYDVIKILYNKNDENIFKQFSYNDSSVLESQYYDSINENFENLTITDKDCRKLQIKERKKHDYSHIFTFDYETITSGKFHRPYMLSIYSETQTGKIKKTFTGDNCTKNMLDYIPNNTLLIAHHAKYDLNFIMRYLYKQNFVEKDGTFYSSRGVYFNKKITIVCSYAIIPIKLKKFGETFNLSQCKAVMPYDIYTEKNITDVFYNIEIAKETLSKQEQSEFLKYIKKRVLKVLKCQKGAKRFFLYYI